MNFGPYIRQVREELQARQERVPRPLRGGPISLRALAEKVGITPTYLSKIEREELPPPSEEIIIKLAAELGEDPDVLLALGGKVSPDLLEIIRSHPKAFAALIRKLRGHPEQEIVHVATVVRDGKW